MCIICKDYESGKLTWDEALANTHEMLEANENDSHLQQVFKRLLDDIELIPTEDL